jgi:hypothetical protein
VREFPGMGGNLKEKKGKRAESFMKGTGRKNFAIGKIDGKMEKIAGSVCANHKI